MSSTHVTYLAPVQCVKCLHVSFWIGHYVAYPVSVTSELQGGLFYVRTIASGVYRDLFVYEGRGIWVVEIEL